MEPAHEPQFDPQSFGRRMACIVSSVLLICAMSACCPISAERVLNARARQCEVVAINSSLLVNRQELQRLEKILETLKQRHPDILSAGVRRNDGRLAVEIGSHDTLWNGAVADRRSKRTFKCHLLGREKWGSSSCALNRSMPADRRLVSRRDRAVHHDRHGPMLPRFCAVLAQDAVVSRSRPVGAGPCAFGARQLGRGVARGRRPWSHRARQSVVCQFARAVAREAVGPHGPSCRGAEHRT